MADVSGRFFFQVWAIEFPCLWTGPDAACNASASLSTSEFLSQGPEKSSRENHFHRKTRKAGRSLFVPEWNHVLECPILNFLISFPFLPWLLCRFSFPVSHHWKAGIGQSGVLVVPRYYSLDIAPKAALRDVSMRTIAMAQLTRSHHFRQTKLRLGVLEISLADFPSAPPKPPPPLHVSIDFPGRAAIHSHLSSVTKSARHPSLFPALPCD
ncbi:hypothetical protein AXG93_4280s1220 [Marchantia polymorpha subsp. ruderalis]|uniref:Uncharacterized protein n=1 Tax=Marchantia polymorpha subsp. ruderalis TaxID=1480154 RepID=A0A176WP58_MARPO|nr:hypothetical protein AXG93_4280s1220 [Marchantia polymorpha subsp. ruderalis]